MKNSVLVLAGPTASGKSALSLPLAKALNGEIVCMDSMQVYRYMDIGTAKPDRDEQAQVKHHLFDILDPDQSFSVAEYAVLAQETIHDIHRRGKLPIFCGGTGLYLRALSGGMDFGGTQADEAIRARYQRLAQEQGNEAVHRILLEKDPESAQNLHPNNLRRVIRALEILEITGKPMSRQTRKGKEPLPYTLFIYALSWPRETLYERINLRVDRMMEMGLLDEVKNLLNRGVPLTAQSMQGLGYKELVPFINGETELEETLEVLKRRTRNYAKRQITWFKVEKDLRWLSGEDGTATNTDIIIKEMSKR
ncbi:MAG: tRNA (adenosine(37)-N6)-dimethylallyltransferase MiaA [Bacillota bacterium]|nr:tRNA (adenosine(37)-N6)-dimethylallyltransferase MiaA [Bacillota bacterium]